MGKKITDLGEKLKLRDVVRLYDPGDTGAFLSMQLRGALGGFTLKGKASLIDDVRMKLYLFPRGELKFSVEADSRLIGRLRGHTCEGETYALD